MSSNPWWHPAEDDLTGWDEPLPGVVRMEPDYCAELPLWGEGFGNIAWQYTKFSPELLDRLVAWQRAFDAGYHWDRGWKPGDTRRRWVAEGKLLAADVRAELGTRATLVLGPWCSSGR